MSASLWDILECCLRARLSHRRSMSQGTHSEEVPLNWDG